MESLFKLEESTGKVLFEMKAPNVEAQLASFGNYLFKRYRVMEYSNDGLNTPLFERMVSDADFCNWKDSQPDNPEQVALMSQFKHGDKVKVFLMPEGEESFPGFTARVTGVHFFLGKVKYDLEIKFAGDFSTRIYNVDSVLVQSI